MLDIHVHFYNIYAIFVDILRIRHAKQENSNFCVHPVNGI